MHSGRVLGGQAETSKSNQITYSGDVLGGWAETSKSNQKHPLASKSQRNACKIRLSRGVFGGQAETDTLRYEQ